MAAATTGWYEQAAGLTFRDEAFIDGNFVPSASGQRFDSVNPATDQVLASVASCEAEDVDRAILHSLVRRTPRRTSAWR